MAMELTDPRAVGDLSCQACNQYVRAQMVRLPNYMGTICTACLRSALALVTSDVAAPADIKLDIVPCEGLPPDRMLVIAKGDHCDHEWAPMDETTTPILWCPKCKRTSLAPGHNVIAVNIGL